MKNVTTFFQLVAKTPDWGFDLSQQIAIALTNKGHHVVTIFLNGPYRKNVADRYPGETIFPRLNHKKPLWRLGAAYILFRLCRQYRFSTVISHHYKPSSLMAFVDRLYPVERLFMINHNPGNLRRPARVMVLKTLFSSRWSYVGVSEWVRRDFLEKAAFLPHERMHVLYNCLDIEAVVNEQLERNVARKHLNIDQGYFVFGNIHRLDPSKGHDYMIIAFSHVAEKMPDAHLVIIGGGDRKQWLENLAEKHGVGGRVHLTGVLPNASRYTKAFDVFVAPSLHEGFGLGLLEGMAAILPTITSTGGAFTEVVADTGLQFPPGDKNKLAERMLQIYNMPAEARTNMGHASYKRLEDKFSKDIYHKNVIALFDSLERNSSET